VDAGRLKLYTIPQPESFGIAYFDDFGSGQFVKAFRATFRRRSSVPLAAAAVSSLRMASVSTSCLRPPC